MSWLASWWARRQESMDRWWRRNGFEMPSVRLPGVVHQGWGWYDSLSSVAAAAVIIAVVLFLFATSMYVMAAGSMYTPPQTTAMPTASASPTSAPTATITSAPTLTAAEPATSTPRSEATATTVNTVLTPRSVQT